MTGTNGLTGAVPYFPVFVWRCLAMTSAISPGSALSASSAGLGAIGVTAKPGVPASGGEPGPELILTSPPSSVSSAPFRVMPSGPSTRLVPPHFNVMPDKDSITIPCALT